MCRLCLAQLWSQQMCYAHLKKAFSQITSARSEDDYGWLWHIGTCLAIWNAYCHFLSENVENENLIHNIRSATDIPTVTESSHTDTHVFPLRALKSQNLFSRATALKCGNGLTDKWLARIQPEREDWYVVNRETDIVMVHETTNYDIFTTDDAGEHWTGQHCHLTALLPVHVVIRSNYRHHSWHCLLISLST